MMRRRMTRNVCGPCLVILAFCSFDAGRELPDVNTTQATGTRKSNRVLPDRKEPECVSTTCRDQKPITVAVPADGVTRQAVNVMPSDPVGAWNLKCVSPDGKYRECIVTVCRDGNDWKGNYQADGQTRAAQDVTFKDGIVSFRVDGKFAGQIYYLTYSGKPAGETLNGTVRWSYGWASGSFPFRGGRVLEQIASTP